LEGGCVYVQCEGIEVMERVCERLVR